MREFVVRLCFLKHCLGHVRRDYFSRGKRQTCFLMPRNHTGRVVFQPTWWQSILRRAAEVLCRHQAAVRQIRFGLELEGDPREIPAHFYRHYHDEKRFSKYEAFYPGDIVSLSCLAPAGIDQDALRELLEIAGKYFGISPGRPNEYGHFEVVAIAAKKQDATP